MSLDLSAPFYSALISDSAITALLAEFLTQPAVFTRRPIPENAQYPLIVVTPNVSIANEDFLVTEFPVVVSDVIAYGEQPSDYRTIDALGYLVRTKFHRERESLSVSGFHVVDIVASGPQPAPTDDERHVGRVVSLTIRLQKL